MAFFSRCNRPTTVPVPVGNVTTPIYEERLVDGVTRLVKAGETNLYEYVQSSKEDTLIYNLLDRFAKGDVTALTSRRGQFIDVTGMPTTLAEAQQVMINATEKFNHLSDEVKAKFGYDVNEYINAVAKASPEQLKEMFGVADPVATPITEVKDGDGNVA